MTSEFRYDQLSEYHQNLIDELEEYFAVNHPGSVNWQILYKLQKQALTLNSTTKPILDKIWKLYKQETTT